MDYIDHLICVLKTYRLVESFFRRDMLRYFNIVGNGDSVFGTVSGENRQKDNPPIRLYLWMIKLMMDEYLYIIEEKDTTKVVSFLLMKL